MKRMRALALHALLTLLTLGASPAPAADLPGSRRAVVLVTGDGHEISVGHVEFRPDGDGHAFAFELDDATFEDRFLAMRPFKCLERGAQHLCYLPYPYPLQNRISSGDFTDLEYALLFIRKAPGSVSLDPWNGVYYRLTARGATLEGEAFDTDLNVIAVPPEPGTRPIRRDALHAVDPKAHPYPRLLIR